MNRSLRISYYLFLGLLSNQIQRALTTSCPLTELASLDTGREDAEKRSFFKYLDEKCLFKNVLNVLKMAGFGSAQSMSTHINHGHEKGLGRLGGGCFSCSPLISRPDLWLEWSTENS
jgi:hypothetical protein